LPIIGGKRNENSDLAALYFVFGLALAGALGFALWLIGGPTLRTVALILAVCLGLALLIGAGALFVRAWRRNDSPPIVEKHYFHDGTRTVERTHTIDGTQQKPILYQLPNQPNGPAFPDLLRAAYQSGLLSDRRAEEPTVDGQARELPPDPDEWPGSIG
jgi:hypothetical protein